MLTQKKGLGVVWEVLAKVQHNYNINKYLRNLLTLIQNKKRKKKWLICCLEVLEEAMDRQQEVFLEVVLNKNPSKQQPLHLPKSLYNFFFHIIDNKAKIKKNLY